MNIDRDQDQHSSSYRDVAWTKTATQAGKEAGTEAATILKIETATEMEGRTRIRIEAGFQHNIQNHQHPTHHNHQRLKRERKRKRQVLKEMPRKREPSKEKQYRIPRIPNSQRRCKEKYILHGKGFILNEFETCSSIADGK
jgi:DNA repair photolyase